jgi:hypothetical protein
MEFKAAMEKLNKFSKDERDAASKLSTAPRIDITNALNDRASHVYNLSLEYHLSEELTNKGLDVLAIIRRV